MKIAESREVQKEVSGISGQETSLSKPEAWQSKPWKQISPA